MRGKKQFRSVETEKIRNWKSGNLLLFVWSVRRPNRSNYKKSKEPTSTLLKLSNTAIRIEMYEYLSFQKIYQGTSNLYSPLPSPFFEFCICVTFQNKVKPITSNYRSHSYRTLFNIAEFVSKSINVNPYKIDVSQEQFRCFSWYLL